ncbi:Asp23/Gls24 family envelope stress response protein [Quadrisphaera sp. KR29]|uniref:Asp23/Gls24 family envelope stress response protein n=1 Tax=Quadrisphaera sp. KR29 TaxID=3461391 RepID=UPI0040448258
MSQGAGAASPAARGTTAVADRVVAKVAALAVRDVPGVHALVPTGPPPTRGVVVEVGPDRASVGVQLVADLGTSLPAVAAAVRRSVAEAVQRLTGLRVTAVDVVVADVHVPADDAPPSGGADPRAQDQGRVALPGRPPLPRTRTSAR